jgi:hypothetical protein
MGRRESLVFVFLCAFMAFARHGMVCAAWASPMSSLSLGSFSASLSLASSRFSELKYYNILPVATSCGFPSLFISPTVGVLASSPLSRPVLGLIRGRFIWIGSPLGGSSPCLGLHLPLPLSQVPHLPSPPLHFALSPTPQLRLLQL